MRHIDRSIEPQILTKNKARWLNDYIASGAARPDSARYAHKDIRAYLKNMSSCKCFYCETTLRAVPSEVDHHIEVSVDKNKAFEWDNLFLACKLCNHKANEFHIASNETLNPCVNSDTEIYDNLTFDNELIMPKNASPVGIKTIKKYHLDADSHDLLRIRQLQKIQKRIIEIDDARFKEGYRDMTEEEKESLKSFTYHSQPYSYMCEVYLRKVRPEVFIP